MTTSLHPLVWKIPLATLVLGGLAVAAGRALFPDWTASERLLAATVLAGGLFVLLAAVSVILGTLAGWILKQGGTDPAWFWFNGEPRGLRQLRGDDATPPEDQEPRAH